jgi:hypothetical protein
MAKHRNDGMGDDIRLNDHGGGEDHPGFLRRIRPTAIIMFALFVLLMIVSFVLDAVGTITFS